MSEVIRVAGESLPPASRILTENSQPLSAIPPDVRPYLSEPVSPHWLRTARNRARFGLEQLRRQAQRWPREYPEQTLLAFAGLAFALGIMLRVWRSAND
jgi:hypothetical protein